MMAEWFGFFSNPGNCIIPTLIALFMFFFGWFAYIWDVSNTGTRKPNNVELAQIYFTGAVCFFLGSSILGYLIVPDNAESLLDLLGVKGMLMFVNAGCQKVILWFLKLLT